MCSILARTLTHATLTGMSAQLDLFSRGEPDFDPAFGDAQRIELAPDAWVDLVPAWLRGHQALFDSLLAQTQFHREQRLMYEKMVETPRLHAILGADGPIPLVVQAMQRALT